MSQNLSDVNSIREIAQQRIESERAQFSDPVPNGVDFGISESELWKAVNSAEDGDAWLFVQIHRGKLIFDHAAGRWFLWHGDYWQEDQSEEIISFVDDVISAYGEGAQRAAWAGLKAAKAGNKDAAQAAAEREKVYLTRIANLQSLRRKRNILTLAAAGKDHMGITGDEWDLNPWLLPCQNGVIDLKTGHLRPARQEDYIKTYCPVRWAGLDAKAPAWEAFLHEVFDNDTTLVLFIQRLLGYSITGLHVEHVFPILWGRGRNGKGSAVETLRAVLGPLAGPIKAEMLLDQGRVRSSAAPDSDVMNLRGRRLIWASETSEGRRFDAGKLKWLVGGDTLCGRAPYGRREVEFEPTHTLFLLTNSKPKADPLDFAFWQRILLIPFTLSFVDDPHKANERKRDPYLVERLKAESSGILAWMIRGCLAWQKGGLAPPQVVRAATNGYRLDEDIVGHFLDECCFLSESANIRAGDLYTAYQEWCGAMGHRPVSGTRFGKDMKDRFQWIEGRHVVYSGIGIRA